MGFSFCWETKQSFGSDRGRIMVSIWRPSLSRACAKYCYNQARHMYMGTLQLFQPQYILTALILERKSLIFIDLQRAILNSLHSLMFISQLYYEKSNMCVLWTTDTMTLSVSLVLRIFQCFHRYSNLITAQIIINNMFLQHITQEAAVEQDIFKTLKNKPM